MDISLVIPVYNEEGNVTELAHKIHNAFRDKFTYEVIWIDDGSTDKTASEIEEIHHKYPEQIGVILMRQAGQSTALMAGFDRAKGDYIATMDGDVQNDPDSIPLMFAKLKAEKLDMVVGWRKHRWQGNIARRLPSLMANYIIKRSFRKVNIHDTGCPVKVMKTSLVRNVRLYGEMHRFISYVMGDMGARIGEIEIDHRNRTRGKSKYGIMRSLRVIMDIINLKFLSMRKMTPIQVFGPISLILIGLSFLSFLITIYAKLFRHIDITGNPMFVVAFMLLTFAVNFIVMALIAELVVRSYFEGSGKTGYYVREEVK